MEAVLQYVNCIFTARYEIPCQNLPLAKHQPQNADDITRFPPARIQADLVIQDLYVNFSSIWESIIIR